MTNFELPKDAEGREIPRNTKVMYDANGKKLHITSFTYKCDVLGLCAQWKVFSPYIKGDNGMLPADSLYLAPPDSWKRLLDDLDNAAEKASSTPYITPCCVWFNDGGRSCAGCPADESPDDSCNVQLVKNIAARIRRLRGEGEDE